MAIKKNTQLLLLLLFDPEKAQSSILSLDKLRVGALDMTDSGFRSLLLFLERKKLIFRERILGKTSIGISEEGIRTLKALFPALDEKWQHWDGKWTCLALLSSPASDPHFRYLRELLLSERALALSRGVYFIPGEPSPRVLLECEHSYSKSVALFSVERSSIGFDRPLVINYYDLTAIAEAYSGISKDIDLLLDKFNTNKELKYQYKSSLYKSISRYISVLQSDPGLMHYYFPDIPDGVRILMKIKHIITL